MSVISPLTASSDIARTLPNVGVSDSPPHIIKSKLGAFTDDVVKISTLALEKQQMELQLSTAPNVDNKQTANEVIRVLSSIGKSQSVGNLTNNQAIELYNKISSLL